MDTMTSYRRFAAPSQRAKGYVRTLRDVLFVVIGLLVMLATPPSLVKADTSGAWPKVWALLICGGAVVAIIGAVFDAITFEVCGCVAASGGFVVWAVILFLNGGDPKVSGAIALSFIAIVLGEAVRVIDAANSPRSTPR
jgi:hypothetical protein